jgi:sortase A
LLAHFDQARLAKGLKALEAARATPADERALAGLPTDNQRIAFFAQRLRQTARAGQPVGRIRIPRIGADFVVVAGTDEASLKKGPGIYSGNAVPGLRGTVGIAGHRTTYLAPFRRINELAGGDRITLEMPYGLFSYTVVRQKIVSPKDVSVLQQAPYDQVVLTACNPLYSAAQRIVVFARLTAAAPAGPALARLTAAPSGPAGPAAARPTRAAPMPVLSPGAADGTILGGPATEPGPVPVAIGPGEVVLGGGAGQAAGRPQRPARANVPARAGAKPARTPAARRRPPATGPSTPSPAAPRPILRAPISSPAPSPAGPAPRKTPTSVRTPAAPPTRKPAAVKAPASSPAPAADSPSTTPAPGSAPSQTRVQGRPGGPVPIIDVPSG